MSVRMLSSSSTRIPNNSVNITSFHIRFSEIQVVLGLLQLLCIVIKGPGSYLSFCLAFFSVQMIQRLPTAVWLLQSPALCFHPTDSPSSLEGSRGKRAYCLKSFLFCQKMKIFPRGFQQVSLFIGLTRIMVPSLAVSSPTKRNSIVMVGLGQSYSSLGMGILQLVSISKLTLLSYYQLLPVVFVCTEHN